MTGTLVGIGAAALLFAAFGLFRMGREPERERGCSGDRTTCTGCRGEDDCVKEARHLHVVP